MMLVVKYSKKQIVIFIMVFLFYSSVFSYLGVTGHPSLAPLNFIILGIVLTGMLVFFTKKSINFLKIPIYAWMLFYFLIILLWLFMPNAYATEKDIRGLILSIIFLFMMTTLIYLDDDKLSMSRKAILFATLLAIFNNVYEFFDPWAFFQAGVKYKIMGRSAGFYINANKAGEAILLGLIFSYSFVSNKYKVIFLIATLIGVLVTFSRTAIVAWFMIVFVMSITKVLDRKNIIVLAAIIGLALLFVIPFLINYIELDYGMVANNLLNRLNFFSSSEHTLDASEAKRLKVMLMAWNVFADHPLVGGGISLTRHWAMNVSTHNIYLKLMAEFGIIGFFIFPLLIASSVWKAKGEVKQLAKIFVIYIVVVGFTTHNCLDSYHFLIAYALMANLSYKSRKKIH